MKHIRILMLLMFAGIAIAQAQNHPPLPSIEQAFNKVKSNPKVYERIKETYNIANPKACKFEMLEKDTYGKYVKSSWGLTKTANAQEINWRWPEDRAYTFFSVTTPESEDGVAYVLCIKVEYSRLKYDNLTNEWHYHWWMFDTPFEVKGKKNDELFYNLTMQKLKGTEGNLYYPGSGEVPEVLHDFTTITKIERSDIPDEVENYSNADFLVRTYLVHGNRMQYNRFSKFTKVEKYYKGTVYKLCIKFRQDKEFQGEKGSDWFIEGYGRTYDILVEQGEEVTPDTLYKTAGRYGFNAVFEKEEQEMDVPFFSDPYKERLVKEVSVALKALYNKEPNAKENMKKYTTGENTIATFEKYFSDVQATQVKLIDIKVELSGCKKTEDENCTIYVRVKYERESWKKNKSLKAQYKNSGMSDAIFKSGGWLQPSSVSNGMECTVVGNSILMTEGPIHEAKDIKF